MKYLAIVFALVASTSMAEDITVQDTINVALINQSLSQELRISELETISDLTADYLHNTNGTLFAVADQSNSAKAISENAVRQFSITQAMHTAESNAINSIGSNGGGIGLGITNGYAALSLAVKSDRIQVGTLSANITAIDANSVSAGIGWGFNW